jgi:general secretion pathway protein C
MAEPEPASPRRGATKLPDDIKDKIQRVSDNEFNVDRSVVDKILENQAELMRSARIVPEQKDGKVVGIRMFGIRPDTLLGSLGLQNVIAWKASTGSTWRVPKRRWRRTRGCARRAT